MKLDRILGQEHLKKKIYDSIEKKIFPQSKILVDRDGYGGLNLAIEIARGLLEVDKGPSDTIPRDTTNRHVRTY